MNELHRIESLFESKCKQNKMYAFSYSMVQPPEVDILIKGEQIYIVTEFKYLGMILHPSLYLGNILNKLLKL